MKRVMRKHAELAIILVSAAIFVALKLVLANKFALLNLYYIPVFLSGYSLGKKPLERAYGRALRRPLADRAA